MQSGALRYRVGAPEHLAAQESDLKEVVQLEIFKNIALWTDVQRGFYRAISRRLTPCCRHVIPEGFLECGNCQVEFAFHGGDDFTMAAATLVERAQRAPGASPEPRGREPVGKPGGREPVEGGLFPGAPGGNVPLVITTTGDAEMLATRLVMHDSTQVRSAVAEWVKRMFRNAK